MNDDYDITQTLGGNPDAQEILTAEITAFFPALETSEGISDEIIAKYYDWIFPYRWTADGGAERRWRSAVRSLCRRHVKLAELEEFFAQNSTDGEQHETYSGQDENINSGTDTDTYGGTDTDTNSGTDTETFTDNRAQKTTVTYRGVGSPTSSANTAETTESTFNDGDNTTTNATERGTKLTRQYGQTIARQRGTSVVMKRGTTRTWTDGRTWTQILNDVWGAQSPLYDFINAFAQILVQPTTCNVFWSPTMQLSVELNGLPEGSAPSASVVNVGTATNAKWVLTLDIASGPPGPQGDPGEKGDPGETPEIIATASVNDQIGTPAVVVTNSGTALNPIIDFAFQNLKGAKGDPGESGIVTPVSGFYSMAVDAAGNLYAYYADDGTAPPFQYDADSGNLYYITPDA